MAEPTGSEMARMIADGISKGISEGLEKAAGPKKVTFGRFDPRTPFHPKKAEVPRLTRVCFQNGRRMNPELLHDEEIRLLNKIHRGGRYIGKRVHVVIRDEGDDASLDLQYRDQTADQRFDNKSSWIDMKEMLTKILAEQTEIEESEPKPVRRSA